MGLALNHVSYGERLTAVSHVFQPAAMSAIIGPNGAGKTTLLQIAAGLIAPDTGDVRLAAHDFTDPLTRARQLAYLPQFPSIAWPIAARHLVAQGLMPELPLAEDIIHARVMAALELCGATDFAARAVTRLSGGERARVMLARLLVGRARFLLLDEPVQSLDPGGALALLDILHAAAQGGRGIVLVLHDINLAARYADSVLLMRAGRVAASGAAGDILTPKRLAPIFGARFSRAGGHVFATRRDK